ncbi:acyl-CoA dehydrogenase family protein [Mycolicibacterium sp. CBMA 226]|uniref:acyl-CoA dehydrogenase family protein n=1 Tax=Mycolicibacterium sp. CBMA 226 TaxID=2606611 RepID=UPI0012DBFB62|nr:acyl-CoA dehydrogenase family protein [Mycolicibacterium sp. CBMA 226]MUL74517.1 acyl-CoA dehydrogenase [Mycolicibacterium sp. CBMA 226]
MNRDLFTEEHNNFRSMIRSYIAREVSPVFTEWIEDGIVPREQFAKLAELGLMGFNIPEQYGGAGPVDYLYNVIISEEAARAFVHLGPFRCHSDIVMPYLLAYANDEQRGRWFPRIAAGELITAIAMTEPGAGSDLAGIRTTAIRDGDSYILNGAKTFVTGGISADLVIVVARTSKDDTNRRNGLSLAVVEQGMDGFTKGRKLQKVGLAVQDTAELSFTDVRVPVSNILGEPGEAFNYLGHNLVGERLSIAVASLAASQAALAATVEYVKGREIFGKALSSFQNTKFELASVATELEAGQVFLDRALMEHMAQRLVPADAAKLKLFASELQGRVVDRCLQLFGGYGYMSEYPIARLYADARVSRIYGGTSEVLKLIIAQSLGLR